MRVLVTGAEGFVGSHLLPALAEGGDEVCSTSIDGSLGTRLVLPDDDAATALVREFRPDAIVHLAAISAVPAALEDPESAWRVNVDGVRSMHRALARHRPDAVFLHISTGAVYGAALPGEAPADEGRPCRPTNVYAWSKLAAEGWLAMTAAMTPRTVIARPFNHIGPGQSDAFALSSFARQIAEAERRGSGEIRTGNLDGSRDFTDVRDVVAAYRALLHFPEARGVYNLCSGVARPVRESLDRLRALGTVETEVMSEASRRRVGDDDPVLGSSDRLRRETGWRPVRDLDDTLGDILEDWRRRLTAS